MSNARPFADLHACARRAARRPDEADDIVQFALLAALESGRTDLSAPATRRWLAGVIRNRAAMDARTAVRRRRRENSWGEVTLAVDGQEASAAGEQESRTAISALSPALRVTALLALNGHTRREIGWLLNLSDAALRQRITQLRRALAGASADGLPEGALAFGRMRRALLAPSRRGQAFLASHDPDGHLFVVSHSQIPGLRQQTGSKA